MRKKMMKGNKVWKTLWLCVMLVEEPPQWVWNKPTPKTTKH